MADKSTLDAIQKLVDARPRELLDIIDGEVLTQENFRGVQGGLVLGLRFLVEDFRKQAELVMDSGARGKGAEATALRGTASTLSLLADAVAKVDVDADCTGATPPADLFGPGLDEPVHAFKPGEGGRCDAAAPPSRTGLCGRYASHPAHRGGGAPDLSGLNALVAERSGVPVPTDFKPFRTDEQAKMHAYLSGETNTMPEFAGFAEPGPSTVVNVGPPGGLPPAPNERGAAIEPAIASMFAEPAAVGKVYGTEPVIPGRRVTFAELRKPAPLAPPEHTSNSQVTQMNDCGLQYRLQRLEPDVIERPQWHLVGGKALHRAAEEFERALLNNRLTDYRLNAGDRWKEAFNTEIIAQVIACPQVPQDDWRAAGRGGAEGYTWWLAAGVDMVQRYLDLRLAELDRVMLFADPAGDVPVLEFEGILDVEGTPHKIVIDQAWRWYANDIVIDDLKSGANAPRGGTFQLGQYAWYLRNELGFTGCKIYGRFWDARKGTYSNPVDLLELHPWDEIVWRIKDAAAKKEAGLFGPNPGPFCNGCAAKHACPVVSRG